MRIRTLHPALADKARIELGESLILLEENIQHLKQWISNQPHLRARTDDQWLAAFVRGCKYRLDQCKTKLDLYYSLRSTAPYLYSIKYFQSKVMDLFNLGSVLILPKTKNPGDPRIILYRIGQYNPKEYSAIDMMAVLTLQQQICFMEDDNLVVAGTVNVIDLAGTGLGHYTQTSIKQLKHLIQAHQEAVPIRIKSIHFLNTPPFFGTFYKLIKPFLKEKSKSRLHVHNKDIGILHDYLSKETLPPEYGGTGPSVADCIGYWKNKMEGYNSFFEEDMKYGTDESKRPTKSQKTVVNETPFRHLEID